VDNLSFLSHSQMNSFSYTASFMNSGTTKG